MEWLTTSNLENMRVPFMPPPLMESNSSNSLQNFNYYGGNSYTPPAYTQTGPVISIPESENIINTYQSQSKKKEMIKKNKRLTSEQLASLEQNFQENFKLDSNRKLKLALELGMKPRQISVWFQNRRARWKVKYLDESYDSLKKEYDVVCRENDMLHDEVKRLRDIIQRHQCLMNRQSYLNRNQIDGGDEIYGIGQYNNRMF